MGEPGEPGSAGREVIRDALLRGYGMMSPAERATREREEGRKAAEKEAASVAGGDNQLAEALLTFWEEGGRSKGIIEYLAEAEKLLGRS